MTNFKPVNVYALRTNAWKKEEEDLLLGLIAELGVTKGSKKAVEILPRTYYACFAKACKLKKSIINRDKVYILVGSMWMLANYDPQLGQYYSLLSTGNPFYYKDITQVKETWQG